MAYPSVNPNSGEVFNHFARVSSSQFKAAQSDVDSCFQSLTLKSFTERLSVLKKAAKLMRDRRDNLALLETLEISKRIACRVGIGMMNDLALQSERLEPNNEQTNELTNEPANDPTIETTGQPMNNSSSKTDVIEPPVWLITGCSTGIGLELAKQAIESGYRTVITARDPSALEGMGSTDQVLVLKLDVTQADSAEAAIKETVARFGRIDVLVNNAGIGYFAAVEESEEEEVRKMFDVNVFGTGRMIWAVLPGMRKQRSGCVVNISSLAGLRGFPALGYYNASKFAVEGLSSALRQEVEPLGLQVMVVEPSGFRTDWAGRSANESKLQIDDYSATAGKVRASLRHSAGHEPGDPVRAAKSIVAAVASGNPPHHLLLGNDAFEGAMSKLEHLRRDFTAGEAVARAADFPEAVLKSADRAE